jgi:membrane-bound lytic murein transglycosylase A
MTHAGRRPELSFLSVLALSGALLFGGGIAAADQRGPFKIPETALEPITFADLDGWAEDDHSAAYATFANGCRAMVRRRDPPAETPTMVAALKDVCRKAAHDRTLPPDQARAFFEDNFVVVRIAKLGETSGLLTGYYEPIVVGSRERSAEFPVAVYRRPTDLVMVGAKPGQGFANRGVVVRKFGRRKAVPYYDRGQIENGALAGRHLEICYLKDPVDAFFMQIQGSARVPLADGSMLRLNYSAHNGHGYTAIGRLLIERGVIPREEMSMDRLRQWIAANPDQGRDLMRANKAFVFFRLATLAKDEEAVGGQGIPLTAGRSIAIDRTLHVYGIPFWIEAELPINGVRERNKFQRLMIGQDTGSAILGPARADIYFGAGDEAGRVAGRIRQQGKFVMLMPRSLDLVAAGALMPMPREKPTVTVVAEAPPAPTPEVKPPPVPMPEARPPEADPQPEAKPSPRARAKAKKRTKARKHAKRRTKARARRSYRRRWW